MPQTASLPASRQEADLPSVRTADIVTYLWTEISVYPSYLQSPKEEGSLSEDLWL